MYLGKRRRCKLESGECETCVLPKEGAMKMMENLIWRKTSVYIAALCVFHPKCSPCGSEPRGASCCSRLELVNKTSLSDLMKHIQSFILIIFGWICSGSVCRWFRLPFGSVFTWFHFQSPDQSINHREKHFKDILTQSYITIHILSTWPSSPVTLTSVLGARRPWAAAGSGSLYSQSPGRFALQQLCTPDPSALTNTHCW